MEYYIYIHFFSFLYLHFFFNWIHNNIYLKSVHITTGPISLSQGLVVPGSSFAYDYSCQFETCQTFIKYKCGSRIFLKIQTRHLRVGENIGSPMR